MHQANIFFGVLEDLSFEKKGLDWLPPHR
jgi:hypothetical protein